MKNKFKGEKGISMVILVVTCLLLIIIAGSLVYKAKDMSDVKKLSDLYNDIDNLKEKVLQYYVEYGALPAEIEYTNVSALSDVLSTENDTGKFYVIDLEALDGLTLNYGRDYSTVLADSSNPNSYKDVYIINENSHNIFYVEGIEIDEKGVKTKYYTNYDSPDNTFVDLRYVDGILIPDGYYYVGTALNSGVQSIVISNSKDDVVNDLNVNLYIWQAQNNKIDQAPATVNFSLTQSEQDFVKSVNCYKGYFKNKNGAQTTSVVYTKIQENRWSNQYTAKTKFVDKNGDIAYIPQGFYVSLADGSNTVRDGLVITDNVDANGNSTGNEYVWIKADGVLGKNSKQISNATSGEIILGRYVFGQTGSVNVDLTPNTLEKNLRTSVLDEDFYKENISGDDYDQNIVEFINSVQQNGGYYVARYEASDASATANRTDVSLDANDVNIKSNGFVYNWVTKAQAEALCVDLYSNIKSGLINSYAWDTAILFIQKYGNDEAYSQKVANQATLAKTGLSSDGTFNDEQCNIFDMANNCLEWTKEIYSGADTCVYRGGCYSGNSTVSTRAEETTGEQFANVSFRPILYFEVE